MTIRAYGDNAVIELFDHHLVITRRRPGFVVDGPSTEQFIPFSSIKSVHFVRPGFLAHGRIVLSPPGGSANGPDEYTVSFPKNQVRQFEDVLRTVRQAIATPSIEHLAMMAAHNRQRVGQSQPPAAEYRQELALSQSHAQAHAHGGGERQGARFSGGYDDRSYAAWQAEQAAPLHTPINPTVGSWWSDMPFVGKIIAIAFVCFMLLVMCSTVSSSPTSEEDTTASADEGAALGVSADQMLADWSEFVTGNASNAELALTDGDGKAGEFCSATTGTTIMTFGGAKLGGGLPQIYDFFSMGSTQDDTGYVGAFWFDRASSQLRALRLTHKQHPDKDPMAADDFAMAITQVSPGTVDVDGTIYHTCVI